MCKVTAIKNASYIIGYENGSHVIYKGGEVVYQGDQIIYVGEKYEHKVDQILDARQGIVAPGMIDLHVDMDALLLEKSTIEDVGNPFHFMDDFYDRPTAEDVSEDEQCDMAEFIACELISKGVTCIYAKGILSEGVIRKLADSGIRVIYAPVAYDSQKLKKNRKALLYRKMPENHGKDILEKTMTLRKKYCNEYDGRLEIAVGL